MKPNTIALVGNPNCGKTTLFNALTGLSQTVGNWPGVTVDKKVGQLSTAKGRYDVVDLPGLYSLQHDNMGLDEQIAQQFLGQRPSMILNIVDASALDRQLLLTHQLLELQLPMVVVVNMIDVAEQNHLQIDTRALSAVLGVPVYAIVAADTAHVKKLAQQWPDVAHAPQVEHAAGTLLQRLQDVRLWVNKSVKQTQSGPTLTERIDNVLLNKWLGIPIFLFAMYLLFWFAINVGAVFIDFFDLLFGAWLVDLPKAALAAIGTPDFIQVLVADGLGGGIQLVATFIPVIAFLYLGLSFMEGTGYMPRAAFVVDKVMRAIGLPGRAFVPLIVGFGCNVPSVMAARSLSNPRDRMVTVAMAPFMSCGARLTVYALFAAALFADNGQNVVFALYLLGIAMAVFTGWLFRRAQPKQALSSSLLDMPAFHVPKLSNILINTWHRLHGFVFSAGKTIVLVVVVLSFVNSWGTDGSFGHENQPTSVLSVVSQKVTPVLAPMGIHQDNWPATVGVVTGIFAKEAVVGTLDALYSGLSEPLVENTTTVWQQTGAAVASIGENAQGLAASLLDPLGLSLGRYDSVEEAASDQGVRAQTFATMAALFVTPWAAFSYLVFILLYTPCVAVMGALVREQGRRWAVVVIGWSTVLAYSVATIVYQLSQLTVSPFSALGWIGLMLSMLWIGYKGLQWQTMRQSKALQLIPVVDTTGCH